MELDDVVERVLVVVPTIELLSQTVNEYRALDGALLDAVVAVCSDATLAQRAALAENSHTVVTTNAAELASAAHGRSRLTVLCTYASTGVISAAHAHHGLRSWDLVIADEAHRTAGNVNGSWTVVHHDALIPAKRRVYMTATPRITLSAEDAGVVSMDDTSIYGPVAHRLSFSRAIERKLLADYQVVVPVVTDQDVRRLADEAHVGIGWGDLTLHPREIAGQIGLLRAMSEYGIRRAITYHHRVRDAQRWARSLPVTAETMREGLELWAAHVCGAQRPGVRRQILDQLAGCTAQAGVVSNARLLVEGVDVPAVECVLLDGTHDSAEATVQMIGRSLRTGGNPDKIATIVLPVLLSDDEPDETSLDTAQWRSVWTVLRALRDHDDRLDEILQRGRAELGRRRLRGRSSTGRYRYQLPQCLHIHGHLPAAFIDAIAVRVIRSTTPPWDEYYGLVKAIHAKQGHLNIPRYFTVDGLVVGAWLIAQKAAYLRAQLSERQLHLLTELNIEWGDLWERSYHQVRTYLRRGGDLTRVPIDHPLDDGTTFVTWMANQRYDRKTRRLTEERTRLLDEMDFPWDIYEARWMRRYKDIKAIVDSHGSLAAIDRRSSNGLWLKTQLACYRKNTLSDMRIRLLRELGFSLTDASKPPDWRDMYDELIAFKLYNGNLSVPRGYRTADGADLYTWCGDQRAEKQAGTLRHESAALLDRVGFDWQPVKTAHLTQCDALLQFYLTHGHLNVPPEHALNSWLYNQRKKFHNDALQQYIADRLNRLHPLWLDERACTRSLQVRAFHTLTDDAWNKIEPIFSELAFTRPSAWSDIQPRDIVNAFIWKQRTGAPWADFKPCFGISENSARILWYRIKRQALWDKIEPLIDLRGHATTIDQDSTDATDSVQLHDYAEPDRTGFQGAGARELEV